MFCESRMKARQSQRHLRSASAVAGTVLIASMFNFKGWGISNGMQRYRCKSCLKTFNAATGTPLARLRKKEKWLEYSKAMVDGLSVRKAARKCGIDNTTSFRWRHRFLHGLRDKKDSSLKGIVEADETFFLESFKGSRNLGRTARKRGGKATKRGCLRSKSRF